MKGSVRVQTAFVFVKNIQSQRMTKFCKNEFCPTAEELVTFQSGEMAAKPRSGITKHLAICEFCSAELEFYSNYPPSRGTDSEEATETAAMPGPLLELAEALLGKKNKSAPFFNRLMNDEN